MQNESKHPPGSDEGQTNFEWLLTQLTPEEGKELADWDYWPYLCLVFADGQICLKDHNGWLLYSGATTLGL